MSLCASDCTGSNWFSAFNDEGIKLLNGVTADQLNVVPARPPLTLDAALTCLPCKPNPAPETNRHSLPARVAIAIAARV